MVITIVARDMVEKVAENARLQLDEEEIEQFKSELTDILDVFKSLDELDTSEVKPSFHPLSLSDRLRQDEVEEDMLLTRKQLGIKDYFQGPMVTGKEGKERKEKT